MANLITAFLISAAILSGCFDAPGRLPPPNGPPSPADYDYRYEWKSSAFDSTYLGVKFRVNNETRYYFRVWNNASWESSSLYFVYTTLIEKGDSSHVYERGLAIDLVDSCDYERSMTRIQDCPQQDFTPGSGPYSVGERGPAGSFWSTFRPGIYALYTASFGAVAASMKIEGFFDSPIPFNESKSVEVNERFFAVFSTTGNRSDDPDYQAVSGSGRSYSFSRSHGGFFFTSGDGRKLAEASFPGTGGAWTLRAENGTRFSDRPAGTVVGIMMAPEMVSSDGRLDDFGRDVSS